MNKDIARYLLGGLLERANHGTVGAVTKVEKEAIQFALSVLEGEHVGESHVVVEERDSSPVVVASNIEIVDAPSNLPVIRTVELNLSSLYSEEDAQSEIILCLDFGTAMSKAFAQDIDNTIYEISLGARAGGTGYAVPSSLFITDSGVILFGKNAIDESLDLVESGRQRLDSIKSFLSLRMGGDLDSEACVLKENINPRRDIRLTEGDLIRMYLAFLTDLALSEMEQNSPSNRHLVRRFAHPCWDDKQKKWAEPLMRRLLAQAQILADTFSGRWADGITIEEMKSALDQVKVLPTVPTWLIAEGVAEPVAVAAGVLTDGTDKRDPFMVIDVGAGTTDFGVFVIRESEEQEICKVFQIPKTAIGLKQAGDKVDQLLQKFILDDAHIDTSDPHGHVIVADLKRRIRFYKEILFDEGNVSYVLADSTTGRITKDAFLSSSKVREFEKLLESELEVCLSKMDESWLSWISNAGLKMVLTGGGAKLPMIQSLASGPIKVGKHTIMRTQVDSVPGWVEDIAENIAPVFDQLAVAIGGAEFSLPETIDGPEMFGGGGGRTQYVAGNVHVGGA